MSQDPIKSGQIDVGTTEGKVPVLGSGGTLPVSVIPANASIDSANNLGGNPPSYYTDASHMISGILPSGRLSGTYNISILGSAIQLNNQYGIN